MKTFLIILIAPSIFFLAGCNDDQPLDNPNCGDKVDTIYEHFTNFLEDSTLLHMSYYRNYNGQTEIGFSWRYNNICTFEHVYVSVDVEFKKEMLDVANFNYNSHVWWDVGYTQDIQWRATPARKEYRTGFDGETQIGLKQVYGDGPGKYQIYLEFAFPYKENYQADIQYLKDSIDPGVEVWTKYYIYRQQE